MQLKDIAAIAAVVVSLISAVAAIDARSRAQELANRQFATDKTLEILASVYSEILATRNDAERAKWSCFFVATLGNAERDARQEPPFYVRTFVEDVARAGLWDPDCGARLEALVSEVEPAATSVSDATEGPAEIGQWHALVASYNVTDFGCSQARDQVERFSTLLADRGLSGHYIYVVRTTISNNYTVTVDTGADRQKADEISAMIRSVAPGDGTGRDSFVQGNRGWVIDPNCSLSVLIGG